MSLNTLFSIFSQPFHVDGVSTGLKPADSAVPAVHQGPHHYWSFQWLLQFLLFQKHPKLLECVFDKLLLLAPLGQSNHCVYLGFCLCSHQDFSVGHLWKRDLVSGRTKKKYQPESQKTRLLMDDELCWSQSSLVTAAGLLDLLFHYQNIQEILHICTLKYVNLGLVFFFVDWTEFSSPFAAAQLRTLQLFKLNTTFGCPEGVGIYVSCLAGEFDHWTVASILIHPE